MTESHKIPNKSEMERFLLTILLGEFQPEEEQESEAIIIRGLISLIPVIDQILDAQDTIAVIYRVSRKNGKLTEDDYLDLGFTLLGWAPELGSVLKTLGKYARKETQGVQNGIEMLEKAFGKSPGAFISKLRNLLDNKSRWTSFAEEAVSKCQSLLNTYLDFLNIIAQGELVVIDAWGIRGAIDLPDYLVNIAQEQIQSITLFQQRLNGAIYHGVEAVREYLLELLGEHALLVETSQVLAQKTMETGNDIQHARVAIADKKAESTSLGKSKRKEKKHPTLNNASSAVNNLTPVFADLNSRNTPRAVEIFYHYDTLMPVVGAPFDIHFEDGSTISGKLDNRGYAKIENAPEGRFYVMLGEDARKWERQEAENMVTNKKISPYSAQAIQQYWLAQSHSGKYK